MMPQTDRRWSHAPAMVWLPLAAGLLTGPAVAAQDPTKPAELASLIATVAHGTPAERERAAMQLGRWGPQAAAAIPVLTRALSDSSAVIRTAAARALGDIGPGVATDKAALTTLIDVLHDHDWRVREAAARTLGQLGAQAGLAIPALSQALGNAQPEVYRAAADALAALGPNGTLALIRALGQPSWWAKTEAADRLKRLGASARPALLQALDNPQEPSEIRLGIIQLLGELGPETIPALVKIVATPSNDRPLRLTAMQALGRIGPAVAADPSALTAIKQWLRDPEPEFRTAASQALATIEPSPRHEPGERLDE